MPPNFAYPHPIETEPVPFHWPTRELPILKLGVRIAEERSEMELDDIATELTLDPRQARIAVEELRDAGYLKVRGAGGMKLYVTGVTERGRVATGSWPSPDNFVKELSEALARAAEREPDGERKRWLKTIADGLIGISRDVVAGEIRLLLAKLGLPHA